jgi:alanine-glyoxylate transaminase/serine-glyoxylate transaminase/serine-pyruvate transaminase
MTSSSAPLASFNIAVGGGLGPLAGRIWRVGLMGSGSSLTNVLLFLSALGRVLSRAGYRPAKIEAAASAAVAAVAR